MIVTYTARRSLLVGHVAGTQYILDIDSTARTLSRRVEKIQQRALSGRFETLWFHGLRVWSVTFVPVAGDDVLALQEFLDSTESGEVFSMTLLGEDVPAVPVKRMDEGYTLGMFLEMGDLATDWLQAAIEVVEQ